MLNAAEKSDPIFPRPVLGLDFRFFDGIVYKGAQEPEFYVTYRTFQHIGVVLCLFVAFLALAGCGRKSPLDAPSAVAADDPNKKANPANAEKIDQGPLPFHKQSSIVLDPLL